MIIVVEEGAESNATDDNFAALSGNSSCHGVGLGAAWRSGHWPRCRLDACSLWTKFKFYS